MNEQSGDSKEKEVMGEGIGELEIEELVPEIEADEKILLWTVNITEIGQRDKFVSSCIVFRQTVNISSNFS